MFKRARKLPNLTEARIQFTHVKEYYTMRARAGDPFFDQDMVDDMDAVREGLHALDVLQRGGFDTGIRKTERVMAKAWRRARAADKHEYGYEIDWDKR